MWDHLNDPGHTQIAETIAQDVKGLERIGLNGWMSCQIQRVFLPTGLPMVALARTLWDNTLDFADIAQDYFGSAFGQDATAAQEYLTEISRLFDPVFLRGDKGKADRDVIEKLAKVPDVIEKFVPVIERNLADTEPCHAQSWFYLKHHAELSADYAKALKAKAMGEEDGAAEIWQRLRKTMWDKEPILHPALDAWLLTGTLGRRFE